MAATEPAPVDPQTSLIRLDIGEMRDAPAGTEHLKAVVEGEAVTYTGTVSDIDANGVETRVDLTGAVIEAEIWSDPVRIGGARMATFTCAPVTPQSGDDVGRFTFALDSTNARQVFTGDPANGNAGAYTGEDDETNPPDWDLWIDGTRWWYGEVARTDEQLRRTGGTA